MLYDFFNYLNTIDIPGAGMFQYISFRATLAFVLSLFIAMVIGRKIINKLQQMQIGETIRDLSLEGQLSKKGTPTMGGIIIIIATLMPCLLVGRLNNIYMILLLVTTVWLGVLGFADDYIKVIKKNKEGMKGKFKIIGQIGLGLIVGLTLYLSPDVVIREKSSADTINQIGVVTEEVQNIDIKSTKTTIPFVKNHNFDYADLIPFAGEHAQTAGWVIFVIISILVVTAVSNGANLTDGLDGLAAGTTAIIGVTLGIFAYLSGHVIYAPYLDIMYIPGSEELVVFISAFVGALIGFLWYNVYPAQVFMGDTGSLTIGGIIAVLAITLRKELLLPLLCGIFLVESLSVILQTAYFKTTKKMYGEGRRIFKMTPLHHHFQKDGDGSINALWQSPKNKMPESRITLRFWIISILLAALTIVTLKIR
ncbi:MAG: phospho-N-acetylmuramoyl-pentapeptide-transferase [Bacteroidales bacterium]|nr:phospho-N-acetylmuramoyl-pentapeptide-transferase [Bacteroidales bacterium]